MSEIKWHLTKEELPKENEYVLIYVPNRPWNSNSSTVFYKVACLIKGISMKEREMMSNSNPRKKEYRFGDEWNNNLVPYAWKEFGPGEYVGQEVVAWAYIDEFKG